MSTPTNTSENKNVVVDLLGLSLANNVDMSESLSVLNPGDRVRVGNPEDYIDYVNNKDNPLSLTTEQFKARYNQAKQVEKIINAGYNYYRNDPRMATVNEALGLLDDGMFEGGPSISHTPLSFTHPQYNPGRVMSQRKYAYYRDEIAVPDATSPGGFKYEKKKPGWEFDGKYVFAPDERSGGESDILVRLNKDDDSFGYEMLSSVWGLPDDYDRNLLLNSMKSMVSTGSRFGANVAEVVAAVSNISNADKEIFNDPDDYSAYVERLKGVVVNIPLLKDRLDKALLGSEDEQLEAFRFIEHNLNISQRNYLKSLRMTDRWNKRNAAFNSVIDAFRSMENMTPEQYNRGALKSLGSFVYAGTKVLADVGLQLALGAATGGSSLAFASVGTIQALGGLYEELRDAGIDDKSIGVAVLAASPVIMGTEAIAGKMWAFKPTDKTTMNSIRESIREAVAEAMKKSKGKLSTSEAVNLGLESSKKIWNNPKFRELIDNEITGTFTKAIPLEAIQENMEDMMYNLEKLVINKQRPDYYGESITTGVNDFWGDDGVINPKQILETTLLTAFATGLADAGRKSLDGSYKNMAKLRDERRKATQTAWTAEQVMKGNIGIFEDMARKESQSDINAFGSKADKLSDMGLDNIEISAENAGRYQGYNIGQMIDGKLIIDNVADAIIKNFVDEVATIRDIVDRHGFSDNDDMNISMLKDLYDINGNLFSTVAINKTVGFENAVQALEERKQAMAAPGYVAKDTDAQEVKAMEDAVATAKAEFDYYMRPEGDTSYSEAVNDRVKSMVTTYDDSVEEVKKRLGSKFNESSKKTIEAIKADYVYRMMTTENYKHLKGVYSGLNQYREIYNKANEERRIKSEQALAGTFNTDDLTSKFNSVMDALDKFITTGEVSSLESIDINGLMKMLNEQGLYIQPSVLEPLYTRLEGQSRQVAQKAESFRAVNDNVKKAWKKVSDSKNPFAQTIQDSLMAEDIPIESIPGYEEWKNSPEYDSELEKNYNDYLSLSADVEANRRFDGANISGSLPSYGSQEAFVKAHQDVIDKSMLPSSRLSVYESFIKEAEMAYRQAMLKAEGKSIPKDETDLFGDMDLLSINEYLERYDELMESIGTARKIAIKMNGDKNFDKHSTLDEKEFINELATGTLGERFDGDLSEIKKHKSDFMQVSGLEALTSITLSQRKQALIMRHQATALLAMNDMDLDIGGKVLMTPEQKAILNDSVVTPDVMDNKGSMSEEQLQRMQRVEDTIVAVMDNLHSMRNTLMTDANFEKLMKPMLTIVEKKNRYTASTIPGFSGSYISQRLTIDNHETGRKDPRVVNDVDEARYDGSNSGLQETVDAFQNSLNTNKALSERLNIYMGLLIQIDGRKSLSDVRKARMSMYKPEKGKEPVKASTYEQETVENTLIAYMSGSRVAQRIHDAEKKAAGNDEAINAQLKMIIHGAMIIPGDYGTGKTKQVVFNAMYITGSMKAMGVNKLVFYSPSEKLKNDMQGLFKTNEKGTKEYKLTSSMKGATPIVDTPTLWVIDEGTLLNDEAVDYIQKAVLASNGNLRTIIMADMNQMRSKDDVGGLPSIMYRGIKTTMLSEQWSTVSPMLKSQTDFWASQVGKNRVNTGMAITLLELPMAYHETVDGLSKGVLYGNGQKDVYDKFMASRSNSKALIFYNKESMDAFVRDNNITDMASLEAQGLVYCLTPESGSQYLIQGLRADEVYVVDNYVTMPNGHSRVGVAMYTAAGRARSFFMMNAGSQAPVFNSTDGNRLPSIGKEGVINDILNTKAQKQMEYAMKRHGITTSQDESTKKKETPSPVTPEPERQQKVESKTVNKTVSILVDGMKKTVSVSINESYDADGNKLSSSDYTFTMDGELLGTQSMTSGANKADMEAMAMTLYQQSVEPVEQKKPVVEPADYTTVINADVEMAPEDKGVILRSQAQMWSKHKGLYATTHATIIPVGMKAEDVDRQAVSALHDFILKHIIVLGGDLTVAYMPSAEMMTDNGSEIFNDVLMVKAVFDDPMFALNAIIGMTSPSGALQKAVDMLRSSSNALALLDSMSFIGTMALPLLEPSVKGKNERKLHSLENEDEDTVVTNITNAYDEAISKLNSNSDEGRSSIETLSAQRDAQIELVKLRFVGRRRFLSGYYTHQDDGMAGNTLEQMRNDSDRYVQFDETTHKYSLLDNLNILSADKSVTGFLSDNEDIGLWGLPSTTIGHSIDNLVRNYLSTRTRMSDENIPERDKDAIFDALDKFIAHLDKRFGRYTIMTDEVPMVAYYNDGLMGGTMDVVVVDDKGLWHLYDIKTARNITNTHKNKWHEQLTMYKDMLIATYPELDGKIVDLSIIPFQVKYPEPKEGMYSTSGDMLLHNGTPITSLDKYGITPAFNGEPIAVDEYVVDRSKFAKRHDLPTFRRAYPQVKAHNAHSFVNLGQGVAVTTRRKVYYGEREQSLTTFMNANGIETIGDKPLRLEEHDAKTYGFYINTGDGIDKNSPRVIVFAPKLSKFMSADKNDIKTNDINKLSAITSTETGKSNEPLIKKLYAESMKIFRDTNLYNILVTNKKIIEKNHSHLLTYIEYKGDYCNPKGENLSIQKENLLKVAHLVYGNISSSLFTPRTLIGNNKSHYLTRAKLIGDTHFFISQDVPSSMDIPGMDAEPVIIHHEESKGENENKVENTVGRRRKFQLASDDAWDMNMFTQKASTRAVKHMLGGRFANERLTYFNGLLRTEKGMEATGEMTDGRINISSLSGNVRMTTPYHETFHVVWNHLLDQEKKENYKRMAQMRAKEDTGLLLDGIALEEWMAGKGFARYAVNRRSGGIFSRFMAWLKSLVDYVFRNRDTLEGLYDDIYSGRFRSRARKADYTATIPTIYESQEEDETTANAHEDTPVVDDLSEVDNTEEEEEEVDVVDKYFNIINSLPGMHNELQALIDGIQFEVISYSPLGGRVGITNSFADIMKEEYNVLVETAKSIQDTPIIISKDGDEHLTTLKDIAPSDIHNIRVTDDYVDNEGNIPADKKKYAQRLYRGWYLYNEANASVVLHHIFPAWNAETNSVERGPLMKSAFDWTNMDPANDGFNATMKLMFRSMPVLRRSNAMSDNNEVYVIDSGAFSGTKKMRFVDPHLLNNLVKAIGIEARTRLRENRNINQYGNLIMSPMKMFEKVLHEHMERYGNSVDADGYYASRYREALNSIDAMFFSSTAVIVDEADNSKMYSLKRLAMMGMLEPKKMDRERQKHITGFLAAFINVNMSYIANNNAKITVKDSRTGFHYSITTYANDFYKTVKERIIDSLNSRLSGGILTSQRWMKKYYHSVHIDEYGTITIGRGKQDEVRDTEIIRLMPGNPNSSDPSMRKPYHVFVVNGREIDGSNGYTRQEITAIMKGLKHIGGIIGLNINSRVINTRVLRSMLERGVTKDGADASKSRNGLGMTATNTTRILAGFFANSLYSYRMQIVPMDLKITIGDKSYSKIQRLPDHVTDIENLLEEAKRTKKYGKITLNGIPIEGNFNKAAKELKEQIIDMNGGVLAESMKAFAETLGIKDIFNSKNSSENERLTGIGYPLPIPSQFYTVINAMAAEASSDAGLVTGQSVMRADGKRQQVLQQTNKINDFVDGINRAMGLVLDATNGADLSNVEVAKMHAERSPMIEDDGAILAPYFFNGENAPHKIELESISEAYGIARDYGSFIRGTNDMAPVDMMVTGMEFFLKGISKGIISTPMGTFSDSGKVYIMNHTITKTAWGKTPDTTLLKFNNENGKNIVDFNPALALRYITAYSAKLQRFMLMEHQSFLELLERLNNEFSSRGFNVILPGKGKSSYRQTRKMSSSTWIREVDGFIDTAMKNVDEQTRREIMDIVNGSDTNKLTCVKLKDGSFGIGTAASGQIPNLTADGNMYDSRARAQLAVIRDLLNRKYKDRLSDIQRMPESVKRYGGLADSRQSRHVGNNELGVSYESGMKALKDIFLSDYKEFARTLEANGMNNSNNMMEILSYGSIDQAYKGDKVNEALFAYYVTYHIMNNAMGDIIGTAVQFNGVHDKTKRFGPYVTPTMKLATDFTLSHGDMGQMIRTGSLPQRGWGIAINDIPYTTNLDGKEEVTLDKAADGSTLISGLWRRFFDVSAGSNLYSMVGDGNTVKSLTVSFDPLTWRVREEKHAGFFITQEMFENNRAYYNMTMDMMAKQDEVLQQAIQESALSLAYQMAVRGTRYDNFSWLDTFEGLLEKGMRYDQAMDELHNIVVQSQFVNPVVYDTLIKSIGYGFSFASTQKVGLRAVNDYNPTAADRIPINGLSSYDINYDDMGIIAPSEQPIDDSRAQAPMAQQEAYLGTSGATLSGELAEKYGENPGIAVSKIRDTIRMHESKAMAVRISNVKLPVDVQGVDFKDVDWTMDNLVEEHGADLDRAIAQYEWYIRTRTRNSLDKSKVPGNFIEMLSENGVSSQVPQMRIKMIEYIRREINKNIIKPGYKGVRVVQASSLFHDMYELKDGNDKYPFTRQEALRHVYGNNIPTGVKAFSDEAENALLKVFTKRPLRDMSVRNDQTVPGEVIMPYIFIKSVGLRREESLRDLFTITIKGKGTHIRSMDEQQVEELIKDASFDDKAFIDSPLVRKAISNIRRKNRSILQSLIDNGSYETMVKDEVINLLLSVRDTMTTFANRVPSNFLGAGAIVEIVALNKSGNEAFIPLGMSLMSDSDFDIDMLATYFKQINRYGLLTESVAGQLKNDIIEIIRQVYMHPSTKQDLFRNVNIREFLDVAHEGGEKRMLNDNTLLTNFMTYKDNKAGADAIGILANTLSAIAWLQTVGDLVGGRMNDVFKKIVDDRHIHGEQSTILRLGKWMQLALDNNKHSVFSYFGVTPEAVPILGIMAARGPELGQSEEDYAREVKEFFNNTIIAEILDNVSLSSSIHFNSGDDIYTQASMRLANYLSDNKPVEEDAENIPTLEAEKKRLLMKALQEHNKVVAKEDNDLIIPETEDGLSRYEKYRYVEKEYSYEDPLRTSIRDLDKRIKAAKSHIEQQEAIPYLEELVDMSVSSEALRPFSSIVSLRNGLPGRDFDFYIKKWFIEDGLGMSLREYVDSANTMGIDRSLTDARENYIDYRMSRSNKAMQMMNDKRQLNEEDISILRERYGAIYDALDIAEIVRLIPAFDGYLKEMLSESNRLKNTFLLDSENIDLVVNEFLARCNKVMFSYSTEYNAVRESVVEFVIDRWFNTLGDDKAVLYSQAPLESGRTLGPDMQSAFFRLDMRNIYDRQALSMHMADFVSYFDEDFASPEDMEYYFKKMIPPYASNFYEGISKAFFNNDGVWVGNDFINLLREVGTGDRKYIGLSISTSNLTEEQRLELKDAFNRLPMMVQNIFRYNEIIVNKLGWRSGSISDIMGLQAYRDNLSNIFDSTAKSMINGTDELITDMSIRSDFMDYMSVKTGIAPYVKDKNRDAMADPFYVHSFVKKGDRFWTKNTHFKRSDDGKNFKQLALITNRAGFSAKDMSIVENMDVISITAEGMDALSRGENFTITYLENHAYDAGIYITDNGVIVDLSVNSFNSVTLTPLKGEDKYDKLRQQQADNFTRTNMLKTISVKANDGSYNAYQNTILFDALSIQANRPFIVTGKLIGDENIEQLNFTANTLLEAIIRVRLYLYQRALQQAGIHNPTVETLTVDKKFDLSDPGQRSWAYNYLNIVLERNVKYQKGYEKIHENVLSNMRLLIPLIVQSSIVQGPHRVEAQEFTRSGFKTNEDINRFIPEYTGMTLNTILKNNLNASLTSVDLLDITEKVKNTTFEEPSIDEQLLERYETDKDFDAMMDFLNGEDANRTNNEQTNNTKC